MKKLELYNPFSAPVFHLETTASTMLDARELAARGSPHGTVIMADVQEAGRGRIPSRPWKAEKGSLLFTLLLRYPGMEAIPQALTLRTGLALALAIEDFVPAFKGMTRVKWPNDLMLGSKKVAGILTEGDGKNVYIGIGVNVAQGEFPPDIRDKAVSLGLAPEARFPLLEAFLRRFHGQLEGPDSGSDSWREQLDRRLYMKGSQVRFIDGPAASGRLVEGTLQGIGPGGELLIQTGDSAEAQGFITGELDVY
ncbi:biotin-(acetyl-CoA-carboxylase) ligase [Treponema primitia ZAS-2]|uniref:Biotin-(Acetyl-CoA-carboxylase) ligase n=1 Tax=Treponema primitia (strain ATCC BAA-887 / DSM 12427 / ZAS-2) TaxID=545694 RepID=F5YMR3_TREPZ|nr:biotin--[acetyl-CoA-carboxylase] ligase [Treponema primitia]AEF85708.1 biotin-(acetyl-CoA-carboxylase) ligase [Treponema primitia ZAS-2]